MNAQFTALQHLGLPACAVNGSGRLVSWNQSASEFFQLPAAGAIGREWHTVINSTGLSGCCALCKARRALRSGQAVHPVTLTLNICGFSRSVIMVPVPSSSSPEDTIGFLILSPEYMSDALPQTGSVVSRLPRVQQQREERVIAKLTTRERDILACVVAGLDARSIAADLGISHATARNYVQRILAKLGAHSKAEAVNVALTYNLLAS